MSFLSSPGILTESPSSPPEKNFSITEQIASTRTDEQHQIMLIDTCRNYHSHAVLYDTEIEGIKELRCSPLETETFNISIKNDLKII